MPASWFVLDPCGMPAMRPSSAAVVYSAVKDQLVSLSLEIEVRERLLATEWRLTVYWVKRPVLRVLRGGQSNSRLSITCLRR